VRIPLPWWWYLLAALAAIALGLLVWWWIRRRRRGGITGDPYADANAAFARIERLRLVDAGEPGRHAALMADVVRRYLSERFEHVTLAQTGHELLVSVRGTSTVSLDALRALVDAVEPVKFAAAPLSADRARGIGDEAREFVHDEHTRATAAALAEATRQKRAA
jgi:hypothetical protein